MPPEIKICPPYERFGSDREPIQAQARAMEYFFHLEDGTCIRDPKGEEFPDDAAALLEAAKVAHELSKARVHAYEWRVVVRNATGRHVGSVPLVPPAGHDQGVPVPPISIH